MIVSIRPINLDDTENIVKWRNTPFVLNNFIDQSKITEESHIKYFKKRIFTGKVAQFIIVCDGVDIGTIFLRDIDHKNKVAEYGIFIGEEDYLGKGISVIASKQILEFAFRELKLSNIFLRVLKRNIGAIKSYKRIGFIEMEKKEFTEISGNIEEIVFMEISKEEFIK